MTVMRVEHPNPRSVAMDLRGDPVEPIAFQSRVIAPVSNYVYDPALGLWVPMENGWFVFIGLISSTVTSLLAQVDDLTDDADNAVNQLGSLLELVNARFGGNQAAHLWNALLPSLQGLGFRKVLGVDAGAYTSPGVAGGNAIEYTGPSLAGLTCGIAWNVTERRLHHIVGVTNPAGGAAGVITLETPVGVAAAQFVIPYLSVPHAYRPGTDTLAITNDTPEWEHHHGPEQFITIAAAAVPDGTTQYVFPCAQYGRIGIQIVWSTSAGTRVLQFNSYGKLTEGAWAGPGAIPAGYGINSWWQYSSAGNQFGGAPVGGGIILARLEAPVPFDSVAVELTVAGSDGNTSVVAGHYRTYGGGR